MAKKSIINGQESISQEWQLDDRYKNINNQSDPVSKYTLVSNVK